MKDKKQMYNFIFAGAISLILVVLLLFGIWPFISSFFGAAIFYVLLKPLQDKITKKWSLNKRLVALGLIFLSLIIIIVPLILVLYFLQAQITDIIQGEEILNDFIKGIGSFFPEIDIKGIFSENLPNIKERLTSLFFSTLEEVGFFLVNMFIMYFIVYYLLVDERIVKKIERIIPFTQQTTDELMFKFKNITYSTIIVSGLLSIFQGFLLSITFLIFGIKGVVIWGVLAAILAFIPVIGTPFVWGPAVIVKFAQADYFVATALLIIGLFISNIDNLIRPKLQHKVGRIHPLVTLLGIFVGIYLFGFVGIIIGPLLISYSFLVLRAFKEEYLLN